MDKQNRVQAIKAKIKAMTEQLAKFMKVKGALDRQISESDPDQQLRKKRSELEAVKFDRFRLAFEQNTSSSANNPTKDVVPSSLRK